MTKVFLVALLSLSLAGATMAQQRDEVVELTCREVDISVAQLERWAMHYRGLVEECAKGKWDTHKGQCIAATMVFDSIVEDYLRVSQFRDKMSCKEA